MNSIRREGRKQPLLTQYCDGKNVKCPGWMTQWGSKYLGDEGKTPYEILTSFYGNDIEWDGEKYILKDTILDNIELLLLSPAYVIFSFIYNLFTAVVFV